jgi:shikimate dehydrogenase
MSDENGVVKVCLSMGFPIKSSKSPIMHTAGFKALGIENQFVFLPAEVKPEDLEKAITAARKANIRGISITMPHKQTVIKYLDVIDDDAEEIGAVNTIVNEDGELTGYNTDWIGAITALEKRTRLEGRRVAVIGAGGAARAIVFGLKRKNAEVKIFNRSIEKAKDLGIEFEAESGDLGDMGEISDYDIIINASSVGMNEEKSPIDKNLMNENHLVFDIVYSPMETQLIKDARSKGAAVIYGYQMLLYQGAEQFKMFTGYEAPIREMEEALVKSLS